MQIGLLQSLNWSAYKRSTQAPEVEKPQGAVASKGRPKSGSKDKKALPLDPDQEEVWCAHPSSLHFMPCIPVASEYPAVTSAAGVALCFPAIERLAEQQGDHGQNWS
jgi:hypothetical protein